MNDNRAAGACECDVNCEPECAATGRVNDTGVAGVSKIALGATGATVAACAACCVLPLAWPAVGLVLSGTAIGMLETSQPWLIIISLVFVAMAWIMVWRKSRVTGRRTKSATWLVLGVATMLLAIALCWREIEPLLIAALGGDG